MRLRDEGGFTLLEILVAMAVFALSSTALVASISGEINGTARIDEMFAASVVADNELAEFSLKDLAVGELDKRRGDVHGPHLVLALPCREDRRSEPCRSGH